MITGFFSDIDSAWIAWTIVRWFQNQFCAKNLFFTTKPHDPLFLLHCCISAFGLPPIKDAFEVDPLDAVLENSVSSENWLALLLHFVQRFFFSHATLVTQVSCGWRVIHSFSPASAQLLSCFESTMQRCGSTCETISSQCGFFFKHLTLCCFDFSSPPLHTTHRLPAPPPPPLLQQMDGNCSAVAAICGGSGQLSGLCRTPRRCCRRRRGGINCRGSADRWRIPRWSDWTSGESAIELFLLSWR